MVDDLGLPISTKEAILRHNVLECVNDTYKNRLYDLMLSNRSH